jgi:uncharacterized protein YndB with AHSA1/START domain
MELKFKVFGRIARPVEEVFEAVVDPDTLSHYFTTGGAKGRIEKGATVTWDFADYPGAFPVEVVDVEPNQSIVLRWDANEGENGPKYKTRVTMTFEPVEDGRTLVSIEEEGWHDTEGGLKASYGNCMGWSQMLCALKAWVEHGINLREGMYK